VEAVVLVIIPLHPPPHRPSVAGLVLTVIVIVIYDAPHRAHDRVYDIHPP